MHEDYQLAYCPIAHVTSVAFADDAFEKACLTSRASPKAQNFYVSL